MAMDASALHSIPAPRLRSRSALRVASNEHLVTLVREGDQVAFEIVYDRHAGKLLSFCRHMLGSPQDAEDAVQRTFASAYRALLADRRAIELRPWLFAIARNVCISMLRQRRPAAELDAAQPATQGLSARVAQREDLRDLLEDMRELSERHRAALLLAELGGFSHAQIGEVLGARTEQVKSYVYQARTILMAERAARHADCDNIREELATRRGAGLLRSDIRRHLRHCSGCHEYADEVKVQRRQLAILLPVAPSLALKSSVLQAALGNTPATGAAAGGGTSALAGGSAKALLVKTLAGVALLGASAGVGTVALRGTLDRHRHAVGGSTSTTLLHQQGWSGAPQTTAAYGSAGSIPVVARGARHAQSHALRAPTHARARTQAGRLPQPAGGGVAVGHGRAIQSAGPGGRNPAAAAQPQGGAHTGQGNGSGHANQGNGSGHASRGNGGTAHANQGNGGTGHAKQGNGGTGHAKQGNGGTGHANQGNGSGHTGGSNAAPPTAHGGPASSGSPPGLSRAPGHSGASNAPTAPGAPVVTPGGGAHGNASHSTASAATIPGQQTAPGSGSH
jgi:RNA polymerase sigma factor (sigma-70 family)